MAKAKASEGALALCPVADRCGACGLLGVPYQEQLARKQAHIADLFADVADESCSLEPIAGMADPRYYRNKVVSPYVGVPDRSAKPAGGRGAQGGKAASHRRGGPLMVAGKPIKVLCGMYEKGTHRVIDSSSCLLENQLAKSIILTVRSLMPSFGMLPYDEDADTGFLRHVMVRVGHTSGEVMVTIVTRQEEFPGAKNLARELVRRHPAITTIVQNINTARTNVILGKKERTLYGLGFILDTLCGVSFRISSQSFYQVNAVQTQELYATAIRMAGLTGTETVMDAYCGTGTIGLVAAKGLPEAPEAHAARVIGVEERPDAVADARLNARHNGIDQAEFVAADAGAFMRENADGLKVDVLFMDPPRSGATQDFLKAAAAMAPSRIVYISCNPDTQLRDCDYLTQHGYHLVRIRPVDMFPHTDHVENVVLLRKETV